jgi:nitroreductase
VHGLAAGAWRLDPLARRLHLRRGADDALGLQRQARAAALDQDVVGDAAAVLVLAMDRAALATHPLGPARAWRHALLEAGMLGERAYLWAGAQGLAVCGVGAFYDDEATALVAADPAREWVLHFVALGLPG